MLRIGLISDTHIPEACARLWPQVFTAFRSVDLILHAGDIYDLEVIDQLGEIAPIYVARGNGDDGGGGRPVQAEDERLRKVWLLDLEGLRVGLIHMPIPQIRSYMPIEQMTDRQFGRSDLDVLVYGDTHVEAIERIGNMLCVNPGSPTCPHNMNNQLGTIGFLEIHEGLSDVTIWQLTETGTELFDWSKYRTS